MRKGILGLNGQVGFWLREEYSGGAGVMASNVVERSSGVRTACGLYDPGVVCSLMRILADTDAGAVERIFEI